jgi:hypothetical protein
MSLLGAQARARTPGCEGRVAPRGRRHYRWPTAASWTGPGAAAARRLPGPAKKAVDGGQPSR